MAGKNDVSLLITANDMATAKFKAVEMAVGNLSSKLGGLSGIMQGAGLAGFGAYAVKAAMDWGNAVDSIIDQTGMAGEEASKLLLIAKRTGIGNEEAAASMAKFGKAISKAKDEMTTASAAGKQSDDIFSRMDIGFDKASLSSMSMYQAFQKVTGYMRNLEDGADKDRVAMELFGKSGFQLHDMLNMTTQEMDKVIDKAQKMGLIMSTEQVAAWEQFERQLNGVMGTGKKVAIMFGNELMPAAQDLLNQADALASQYAVLDDNQKALGVSMAKLGIEMGAFKIVLAGMLPGWLKLVAYTGLAVGALDEYLAKLDEAQGKVTIVTGQSPYDPYGYISGRVQTIDVGKAGDWEGGGLSTGQKPPPEKKTSSAGLRPVDTSKASDAAEKLAEKVANIIDDFSAKIMQESGTTFEYSVSRLEAEINKTARELDDISRKGIDTTEARSKLDEYHEAMLNKFNKDQARALASMLNDTMSNNAAVTGDYKAAAEAQYKAALLSIQKQVEERKKSSGNTTAVLAWEVSETKKAEQQKLQAITNGAAQEHEQRLNTLQYQRDVLGMSNAEFTAAYQNELRSFIDANTEKLKNASLIAEERERIEQKVTSAVVQMHRLAGQNVSTAWEEAMYRMDRNSYDYAGRITSMFDEMGSDISTALYDTIMGTGDGAKNLIEDLCKSILKMWTDMVVQMYIMTPMKNAFSSMLNSIGGGSSSGSSGPTMSQSALASTEYSNLIDSGSIGRFASGGYHAGGWAVVGENGPELANFANPARIYTAGDTQKMLSSKQEPSEITVILNNNTGNQMQAKAQQSFDGARTIITLFLEGYNRNINGIQSLMPMGGR